MYLKVSKIVTQAMIEHVEGKGLPFLGFQPRIIGTFLFILLHGSSLMGTQKNIRWAQGSFLQVGKQLST